MSNVVNIRGSTFKIPDTFDPNEYSRAVEELFDAAAAGATASERCAKAMLDIRRLADPKCRDESNVVRQGWYKKAVREAFGKAGVSQQAANKAMHKYRSSLPKNDPYYREHAPLPTTPIRGTSGGRKASGTTQVVPPQPVAPPVINTVDPTKIDKETFVNVVEAIANYCVSDDLLELPDLDDAAKRIEATREVLGRAVARIRAAKMERAAKGRAAASNVSDISERKDRARKMAEAAERAQSKRNKVTPAADAQKKERARKMADAANARKAK